MRQPADRVAFATACGTFNQIVVPNAFMGDGCKQRSDRLQLVIAGKDQGFLAELLALVGSLFLHRKMQEAG